MLKIKNISKKFNHVQVLRGFSCNVAVGDFVVIMGSNGSGKTTLFDIIAGKTMPDEGTVEINGVDCLKMKEEKRANLVGRLFQNTYLGSCSNLSIRENLAMSNFKQRLASMRKGVSAFPENIVMEMLIPLDMGLEKMLDVKMGALSGGQRQIISFLMTIINQPKLLLLDEPTAALDPKSATKLLQMAKDYSNKNKIPTLLITHDPMIAKHLGNRLWILEEGGCKRELNEEKRDLNPSDFFQHIIYHKLE